MQGKSISGINDSSLVFRSGDDITAAGVRSWKSNYSTTRANSAMWLGVSSINFLSGGITIASGPNINITTDPVTKVITVSGAAGGGGTFGIPQSARWESNYNTTCANSGMWGYNSFLNFNPHIGLENENTYPIYTSNENTVYSSNIFSVRDSRNREFIFYTSSPGPTQRSTLYKASYSVTNPNFLYLNAEPVLEPTLDTSINIVRFESNYAIIKTTPLSGANSLYSAGSAECRYYIYEFPNANFSTFDIGTGYDITTIITEDGGPGGVGNMTLNMELITSGTNKFILKTKRSGLPNAKRYVEISLWDYGTLAKKGNSVTIFADRDDPNDTLFFLNTALPLGQPLTPLLSAIQGYPPNLNMGEYFPRTNLKYIPTANTIFGDIYYNWSYTADINLHSAVAVHFDVPEDLLDTGFLHISALTAVSPATIDFATNNEWIGTAAFPWETAPKWGAIYAGVGNQIFYKSYQFVYDINDSIFWCDIPLEAASRKIVVGPINWDTFIYSFSASPYTSVNKPLPQVTPYDADIQTNAILLSSNCMVFPSRGKSYNADIYSSSVMQWNVAELLPQRTLLTNLTSNTYNITAHEINMKAGSLTALSIKTDAGNVYIQNDILNSWIPSQRRQVFSTTIDASENITYYCWASGGANVGTTFDRSALSWPIYKTIAARDGTGSIIISGIEDRQLFNPCHPDNFAKFDTIDNPDITTVLSSCYIKNWGISGNNTVMIIQPSGYKNPDLDSLYGGDWYLMSRLVTFNHDTSSFSLKTTPCASAYWYAQFTANDLYAGYSNTIMINLNENIMYYGCSYGPHARAAVKSLDTYLDIWEASFFATAFPTNYSVLCAADFNMGRYMVIPRPTSSIYDKFVGIQILSEYNAEDAVMTLAAPKTFNQLISSSSFSGTYAHIFSKRQLPELVAYLYDYPLFINGRYYGNPIGSQTLSFEPNATTQVYIEADPLTGVIEVTASTVILDDTYNRIRIATIVTDNSGVSNIKYFKINGFDPGQTLDQFTQSTPVSTFNGTTLAEASATNIFLKVNISGKEYGLLLWDLPV